MDETLEAGRTFVDRVYMENMVRDHKKDVADFQKESTSGSDPTVKQFASQAIGDPAAIFAAGRVDCSECEVVVQYVVERKYAEVGGSRDHKAGLVCPAFFSWTGG